MPFYEKGDVRIRHGEAGSGFPLTRTTGESTRSHALRGCAFMLGMAVIVGAQAQAPVAAYPNRPVRLVVPYAPGGNIDITGRIVAPAMSDTLGVSFVVDNR